MERECRVHLLMLQDKLIAAQLGVISHGDTAVIDQDAGSGILHLFCQSSNLLLFLFENISVRQNVSPPKVI